VQFEILKFKDLFKFFMNMILIYKTGCFAVKILEFGGLNPEISDKQGAVPESKRFID
jgi:hypothetical protein